MIEGIANQYHDFIIKDTERHKLTLEKIMDDHVPKDALIIINGGQSPQEIYFANRRGWTMESAELNAHVVDSLSGLGAQFLVLNHHRNPAPVNRPAIFSNADYSIFQIESHR